MATTAMIGLGAQFKMDNSSGTLTAVAEVIEIGLPNPQTDEVEATHFLSSGRQREYISGLIDNSEIQIRINWVPGSATDTLVSEAQSSGTTRDMEILVPSGASTTQTFSFPGIVKGFEKDVPLDDRMTAVITVRVAGAVTQAATT